MSARAKILLIEDDESFVNSVRLMLRGHPIDVTWASTGIQGIQSYRKNALSFATVVVDYMLPDQRGSEVAQQLKKINPLQDVLFASGHREPEYLSEMLETGCARTFIPKGRSVEEVRGKILDSIDIYERSHRVLGQDDFSSSNAEIDLRKCGFIGRSAAMHKVVESIEKFKDLDLSVRIIAETGTGKELAAKALVPKGKILIPVNCPEFTSAENRMESDLFGHVKGSFTGADSDKPGYLLQAHGQVLFLDEVHTLSTIAQQKFLRVLQERKFRRSGDHKGTPVSINFRLISGAKPEIREYIKNEQFSEDLFHRLGMLEITIPPLRERIEDIEPLTRYFQDRFNSQVEPNLQRQFRISTIREMEKYSWTGNVRQLEGAVYQMMATTERDIINPSSFDAYLKLSEESASSPVAEHISVSTQKVERDRIVSALKTSSTQLEASAKLGVNRFVLMRKMSRLGIDPRTYLLGN